MFPANKDLCLWLFLLLLRAYVFTDFMYDRKGHNPPNRFPQVAASLAYIFGYNASLRIFVWTHISSIFIYFSFYFFILNSILRRRMS